MSSKTIAIGKVWAWLVNPGLVWLERKNARKYHEREKENQNSTSAIFEAEMTAYDELNSEQRTRMRWVVK